MEEIFGHIERITFYNPENGYTIAKLSVPKTKDAITLAGNMPALQVGETVRCFGAWKQHLIHGNQFTVEKFEREAPADIIGIKKYLASGLIKGIGPKYAERIVEKFKTETLTIIDKYPERLSEIEGLGPKRVQQIQDCWKEQKSIRDVMVFLQGFGVSPTYAQKIFKCYGEKSIERVKENPYSLAKDIFGIGFKIADAIAEKMGIAKDSIQRIEAGIRFVLDSFASDGHTCFPLEDFVKASSEILQSSDDSIKNAIETIKYAGEIEVFDLPVEGVCAPFIWNKPLFLSEIGIAKEILRLKKSACRLREVDTEKALEWVQRHLGIELAENQKAAVIQSLTDKVQIITGGPGTGKSTITKAILTITEKLSSSIILAAPTGRAAKRMTEITGKKASTIHSLLEFDFKGGFKKNKDCPLDCDLIIIDEASMIDTFLMYSLLKAIPDFARVILVGDINQLPSVGPGNVLKDIIASGCTSVTMLNEIFRQAAGSRITTNAHRINQGAMPDIRNLSDSDFFFLAADKPEDVLQGIVSLVSVRLPKKYRFDPFSDIQVLAPMKKGPIGTENLNLTLQQVLNPKDQSVFHQGRKLSIGDKVMQIRNNYKKEVFNGDIGRISEIDVSDGSIVVSIDDKEVVYQQNELDEIVLSYAVSIHKYQGSECPCVIIPVHTSHFKLLTRNLLYTGVTRGKRLVILVGMVKALAIGVHNDQVKKRYTGLQQALRGIISPFLGDF